MDDFRKRLMKMLTGGGGGHNLPPEYQEVEWLLGSNGCKITTGITISAETTMYVHYEQQPNDAGTNWNIVAGIVYDRGMYWCIQSSTSSGYLRFNGGNAAGTGLANVQFNVGTKAGDDIEAFLANKNGVESYFIKNGTKYGNSTSLYTCVSRESPWLFSNSVKIYESKFCEAGILIRHFIPCCRIADSEPGMYDIVGGRFYPNEGTGSFTVGPDVI